MIETLNHCNSDDWNFKPLQFAWLKPQTTAKVQTDYSSDDSKVKQLQLAWLEKILPKQCNSKVQTTKIRIPLTHYMSSLLESLHWPVLCSRGQLKSLLHFRFRWVPLTTSHWFDVINVRNLNSTNTRIQRGGSERKLLAAPLKRFGFDSRSGWKSYRVALDRPHAEGGDMYVRWHDKLPVC